jgi:hypothetical protein
VARPGVGPPALGRATCQELSPLTSWRSPRAPAEAMGMAAGPGSAQLDLSKNLTASQAEPAREEYSLSSLRRDRQARWSADLPTRLPQALRALGRKAVGH